jgi:hypothetical protein
MHIFIGNNRTPGAFSRDILDKNLPPNIEFFEYKAVAEALGEPRFFGRDAGFALFISDGAANMLRLDIALVQTDYFLIQILLSLIFTDFEKRF